MSEHTEQLSFLLSRGILPPQIPVEGLYSSGLLSPQALSTLWGSYPAELGFLGASQSNSYFYEFPFLLSLLQPRISCEKG